MPMSELQKEEVRFLLWRKRLDREIEALKEKIAEVDERASFVPVDSASP